MTLPLPIDDALGVAEVLVATGRALPAAKWVDSFRFAADRASFEGIV